MATTNTTSEVDHKVDGPQSIAEDQLALNTEKTAASFLNVTQRALQGWRLKGSGPKFIRISARCIRYRKIDLVAWSESLLKLSTSEK